MRTQILASLSRKKYRDELVAAEINTGLSDQIRAMRDDRGWSQRELGERAGGIQQEVVSQLEDPDYGAYTIRTLKRLAAAFDVGVVVRFVPFSQFLDWFIDLPSERLTVPSFEQDTRLHRDEGHDGGSPTFEGDTAIVTVQLGAPASTTLNGTAAVNETSSFMDFPLLSALVCNPSHTQPLVEERTSTSVIYA